MPERIHLSRAKGWRLPPNSVKVDRTTKWGNPYTPTMLPAIRSDDRLPILPIGAKGAVEAFDKLMQLELRLEPVKMRSQLDELRGKNLACWCKHGAPCHADILLRLANEP